MRVSPEPLSTLYKIEESAPLSGIDYGERHREMTLRIKRLIERGSVVFTFSGRIRSNPLPDIEALLLHSELSVIALDLTNVRLVDRETVRFLANLKVGGIELRNSPEYIREWVAQEASDISLGAPENIGGKR